MKLAAIVLLAVGIALSLLNWACLLGSWCSKRHISPVFPAPSVFTALGLALLETTRAYWWMGLLTDYTFLGVFIVTPSLITDAWRTSSFTRIQLLKAKDGSRHFVLSLHRDGRFFMRATFIPPMICNCHGACIGSFGAVGRWQNMPDGLIRLWGYSEERILTLQPEGTDYFSREEHYPESKEFPYDSFDGLRFRLVV